VSAAGGLTFPFREIASQFESETGITVRLNFGSTGHLAQQIEFGAPADLFAAADQAHVDELIAKGRLVAETRTVFARGALTIWARKDMTPPLERLEDLLAPRVRRVAIANPDRAPYGIAAREALERTGLWDGVQPKLILAENLPQALQYAESGNADAALLALSTSIDTEGAWVLIPDSLHRPIEQTLAVVAGTPREREARAFAAFVTGPSGRTVLERYGLTTIPSPD
jgi:molybdate transport system substrate-binding protein